jgi:hypothetical protein
MNNECESEEHEDDLKDKDNLSHSKVNINKTTNDMGLRIRNGFIFQLETDKDLQDRTDIHAYYGKINIK